MYQDLLRLTPAAISLRGLVPLFTVIIDPNDTNATNVVFVKQVRKCSKECARTDCEFGYRTSTKILAP